MDDVLNSRLLDWPSDFSNVKWLVSIRIKIQSRQAFWIQSLNSFFFFLIMYFFHGLYTILTLKNWRREILVGSLDMFEIKKVILPSYFLGLLGEWNQLVLEST